VIIDGGAPLGTAFGGLIIAALIGAFDSWRTALTRRTAAGGIQAVGTKKLPSPGDGARLFHFLRVKARHCSMPHENRKMRARVRARK